MPNSLGPAELLLHYGTDEQKNHYLPRLADGREIPCFALTGPSAGSDATSIPDYGIVCEGEWNGAKVLGVRLSAKNVADGAELKRLSALGIQYAQGVGVESIGPIVG